MKVIKPGREQIGWAKEFTCTGKGNGDGGCGAVLLVEEDDMYHYDGSTDSYNTFKCCGCGVETDLPDSEVPTSVQQKMKDALNVLKIVSKG